jgi:hypothetical protein
MFCKFHRSKQGLVHDLIILLCEWKHINTVFYLKNCTNIYIINLVFVGPCIIVNSYRNNQQDATVYQNLLFHVYMKLNVFQATHRPSSGAQNCTSSLWLCIREKLWSLRLLTASSNLNDHNLSRMQNETQLVQF